MSNHTDALAAATNRAQARARKYGNHPARLLRDLVEMAADMPTPHEVSAAKVGELLDNYAALIATAKVYEPLTGVALLEAVGEVGEVELSFTHPLPSLWRDQETDWDEFTREPTTVSVAHTQGRVGASECTVCGFDDGHLWRAKTRLGDGSTLIANRCGGCGADVIVDLPRFKVTRLKRD